MTPIERAGYIAHSMSKGYQNKLAKAQDLIGSHPDYAVSVSWGKDSIVLLHLVSQILSCVVALHGRYQNINEHIADTDRVRDAMLGRDDMAHVEYHEIAIAGEWDMFERAGGAFCIAKTDKQKEALQWWINNKWSAKANEAVLAHGCIGSFVGMRQDEARARRITIATKGNDYQKADGDKICLPIARWTGADIWAYIVTHDLPYLSIYDNSINGRERARSEFIFSGQSADALKRHGVWQDWERAYPAELGAWLARFPELNRI